MSEPNTGARSGLSEKKDLLKQMVKKRRAGEDILPPKSASTVVPEAFFQFDQFPVFQRMQIERAVGDKNGIRSPFFVSHDGAPGDTIEIDGRKRINFSTYNYVGLNGHPRVNEAAVQATHRSGTSASASRLVSGECPQHRDLEVGLAKFLDTQDSIVFVSGHTTNLSTITALLGSKDMILCDRLSHNSIVQGAVASGAHRLTFPHNDMAFLDQILRERRHLYERVMIVAEGIYSMDGDVAPLPELIEIKNRHRAILMIDEAHSIGVLGETGRGITEHFGVPASEVDILMGTLSKVFAGCGGYIAGSAALVKILKYTASGFVYSVGMPPPIAAASKAALDVLEEEPERVRKLRDNGRHFLEGARALKFNTGLSEGHNIVPLIIGNSVAAVRLSNALLEEGINVQPIYYPAVEEGAARLRFFLSSLHSFEQIDATLAKTAELLQVVRADLI